MEKINAVFGEEWRFLPVEGANEWPTVGQLKKKVMVFTRLEDPVEGTFDVREWNTKSLDDIVSAQIDVPGTNLKIALQDRYTQVTNTDLTDYLDNGWLTEGEGINEAKFIRFEK